MFDLTAKSDGEAAATAHPGKFVPRYQAVPGTPVAAVGFACTLLAMEGFCLSLVFWVGVDTSPATLAGAALSIGLLLLVADSTMPGAFPNQPTARRPVAPALLTLRRPRHLFRKKRRGNAR